jgi:cytochrome c-type biogenesis protein CcmE
MKAKHQRLVLVIIALAALIGAGLLASWSLRNQASFFYLPDELMADPPEIGRAVRLGGMVATDSIEMRSDGVTVAFIVTDQADARVPVQYSGILPDLFVEGSGVVAEGSLAADGTFIATNLLAKHDENYVPRELEGMHEARDTQNLELATVGLK